MTTWLSVEAILIMGLIVNVFYLQAIHSELRRHVRRMEELAELMVAR